MIEGGYNFVGGNFAVNSFFAAAARCCNFVNCNFVN